jgi:hypothetical protein
MGRRTVLLGSVGAAAAAALVLAAWLAIGRPVIEVQSPDPEQRIGVDGIELLARFEPASAVEPATVRVLLNGADVTGACVTGRNGVHGRLQGLLEGENRVRVEAFVRRSRGLLVEESREVRVWFRPPLGFDQG